METTNKTWKIFQQINRNRRAIRHFSGEMISDEDMRAILSEAQLAPSSNNLQLYSLHWVKDAEICKAIAAACKQSAGTSASTFVVLSTNWKSMKRNYNLFLDHLDTSNLYDEKTKIHYHGKEKQMKLANRFLSLRVLGFFKIILSWFTDQAALAPFGRAGIQQWAARNSIWAAQTLLLAASAKGIDTCPMEGFHPGKVAKAIHLKDGEVISIVISLGKRAKDARVNTQWRLPFHEAVVEH